MLSLALLLPVARPTPAPKTLFSVFYWWYPYAGAQWLDRAGELQVTQHSGGLVRLEMVGLNPLSDPPPYMQSEERPGGETDPALAINWYYRSMARGGAAGIDVFLLPVRPDLQLWLTALKQMRAAQTRLESEGKPFPLLALMADGVEYWHGITPADDLTFYSPRYRAIFEGLRTTLLHEARARDRYFQYNGRLPIFFYRIEGGDGAFRSDNYWIDRLRADIYRDTGESLYVVLDEMWNGYTYGGRTMATTAADNWFLYGANVQGRVFSKFPADPLIANITTGFDGLKPSGFVSNPQHLGRSPALYTARWQNAAAARWIVLETFNFVEENSHLDTTPAWGDSYLKLTARLKAEWLSTP